MIPDDLSFSRRLGGTLLAAAVVLFALASITALTSSPAHACGRFFPRDGKSRPNLALERSLIIHDAAASRQHFIRQIAFRDAGERFGFVVPTPTRPEVAAVKVSPFDKLARRFPFPEVKQGPRGVGTGHGYGSGKGRLGGVQVLEADRIGSFTAFVLAANDAEDLAQWLRDNGLESAAEAEPWLAHYVGMRFYYVALRYDPPKKLVRGGAVRGETVRISFSTPVPYYPYYEPSYPGDARHGKRALELWLIASANHTPVALKQTDGEAQWVQPLKAGRRFAEVRASVEGVLGDELKTLLPKGQTAVQVFQDQKRSRAGYGDILFVQEGNGTLTDAAKARLKPLLGVLDPTLRNAD